jgi:hypothetical protein
VKKLKCAVTALAALSGLAACSKEAVSADAVLPAGDNMRLGMQTHFSQAWASPELDKALALKTMALRDSVRWTDVEQTPGVYNFSNGRISVIKSACSQGVRFILTQPPTNPLYDGGKTVWSATGMGAYAAFVDAVLKNLGSCVMAVEVGNEINGNNLNYPTGTDKFTAYVSLLSTLRARIKPLYPNVAILGGSTNQIGTGFLKLLFAKGMLPLIDGIPVHPYRSYAHGVDLEVAHLAAAMQASGRMVPVWVTEFSHDLPDSNVAAAELLKMITLLSASNIDGASWYALIDQPYFPNMGLYNSSTIKPTGKAFLNARNRLIPYGRPKRLALGDPLLNAWQFSDGRLVVWGAPRTLTLTAAASIYNTQGVALPVASKVEVGNSPVIIVGASIASVGQSPVLADTLTGYGTTQWGLFGRSTKGVYTTLSMQDDWFTSFYGNRYTQPLRIGLGLAAPGGTSTLPIRAVLRYTATETAAAEMSACFGKKLEGDGVDYAITRNGTTLKKGVFTTQAAFTGVPINLTKGDIVEVSFGPNLQTGKDGFKYRAMIFRKGASQAVACP